MVLVNSIFALICLSFLSLHIEATANQDDEYDDALFYLRKSQKCTPFTRFKSNCNSCVCAANGKPSCTRNKCSKVKQTMSKKRDSLRGETRINCEPFTTFKLDCNTCLCNPDGKSAHCTYKKCEGDTTEVEVKKLSCNPYQLFNKDCNTCFCNEDGHSAMCTTMDCDASSHSPVKEDRLSCVPNSMFMKRCNVCFCSSNGRYAMCTQKHCHHHHHYDHEYKKKETSCVPYSNFKIKCNRCHCSSTGTYAYCTNKDCDDDNSSGGVIYDEGKTKCKPFSKFKKDCNWCYCSADGKSAQCTLIACDMGSGKPKKYRSRRSIPGYSSLCKELLELRELDNSVPIQFRAKCNNCSCNPVTGEVECTNNLCLAHDDPRMRNMLSTDAGVKMGSGAGAGAGSEPGAGMGTGVTDPTVRNKWINSVNKLLGRPTTVSSNLCKKILELNQLGHDLPLQLKTKCNICLCNNLTGLFECTKKLCLD